MPVHAKEFKEGTHYAILDRNKITGLVSEVFSVYCSYCLSYELQVIPKLKEALPKGVVFEEMHVKEKGRYGPVVSKVLAALLSISTDSYQKAKMAYYRLHFIDGKTLTTEEEYVDYGLKAADVSKNEYDKALASPEVQAILNEWDGAFDVALYRGTPSILVNNKYIVLMGDIKNQKELDTLVLYLLEK